MAPSEYAIVEEWYAGIKPPAGRQLAYGLPATVNRAGLSQADERRRAIGLRSVALQNKLVALEKLTGMQLYLDGTFGCKETCLSLQIDKLLKQNCFVLGRTKQEQQPCIGVV